MKRVQYKRYGGPEQMYMGDYALPPLGPMDVRIGVRSAAINPVDWKIRRGTMRLMTGWAFPRGMGCDFAGVVEAIGDGVTTLRVGDEVFGTMDFKRSGAFAPTLIAQSRHVAKKPSSLSFSEAACLPIPAATAWAAIVDAARAQAGSRIFINGCSGAVGAFAVQLARARGAQVSGTCGSRAMVSVKAAGVEPVFGYDDKAALAANGKFDAVFDTLGTLGVREGLSLLKPDGVFIDINPAPARVVRGLLSRRYKLVLSTMGLGHLAEIADMAKQGKLRPTIGQESPFGDALSVITNVETGLRPSGRVLLVL